MLNFIVPALGLYLSHKSAQAQKAAGRESLEESKRQAYDIQTSRVINQAQAKIEQNRRKEALDSAEKSNIALFNKYSDASRSTSVKAFMDENKRKGAVDMDIIGTSALFTDATLAANKRTTISEGHARLTAANIGAFTTRAAGIYRFAETFSYKPSGETG